MPAGSDVSPARFETTLRTVGLLVGPSAAIAVYLAHPGGLEPPGRRLLAILALTVVYWMTEAIPLPATALLASALAILSGVAPARDVFQPYADPVIFLFVGSFLLAEAFRKYGLDRRVADLVVARSDAARNPGRLLWSVGGATAFVSCWLSNTATAALMTPMALGIADAPPAAPAAPPGSRSGRPGWLATGLLLLVAYAASVGGMMTLVGTPPNLLTAGYIERLTGVKISFAAWLVFGVPLGGILLIVSIVAVRIAGRLRERAATRSQAILDAPSAAPARVPDGGRAGLEAVADESHEPEPAFREPDPRLRAQGARLTIAAFVLAGALWTLPALLTLCLGADAPATKRLSAVLPEAAVALLCAALLFVAPLDWRRRRFALTWAEGRRVDWGILLLFGGGLSLGTLAESTGVARVVGGWLSGLGLARTESGFLLCAIALTILVSEFASNTASASLLVPLVIATAEASGFEPVRPALAVGMAATCGFMFPVSSPPNAIVYGTGRVPLTSMIPLGAFLDVVAIVTLWVGFLLLAPWLPR